MDETKQTEPLCDWVLQAFPGAEVKEAHFTMAEFVLPATSKWGDMFDKIETNRATLGIVGK